MLNRIEHHTTKLRAGRSNRSGRATSVPSVPDTWVTFHSGDFGLFDADGWVGKDLTEIHH